jgi:hypothetical protein
MDHAGAKRQAPVEKSCRTGKMLGVIATMAKGDPEARATEEAKAALARMGRSGRR